MNNKKIKNKCKIIRKRLFSIVSEHFGLNADWVQNHISTCPRCQQRFASLGKVHLALSIIKSQPHKLNLLMRANTHAVNVLKHDLRNAPKANKLRYLQPEPTLLERFDKYKYSVANTAACIAILCMMKIGVFSSMEKFQSEGQKTIKQYYAAQAGQDLADEIFTA